jgi:hypothetical protein
MTKGCNRRVQQETRRHPNEDGGLPTTLVPLVEQDPDGEVRAVGAQERPGEQSIAVEELRVRRPPLLGHAGLPVAPAPRLRGILSVFWPCVRGRPSGWVEWKGNLGILGIVGQCRAAPARRGSCLAVTAGPRGRRIASGTGCAAA